MSTKYVITFLNCTENGNETTDKNSQSVIAFVTGLLLNQQKGAISTLIIVRVILFGECIKAFPKPVFALNILVLYPLII
jgi:hypothetical protein